MTLKDFLGRSKIAIKSCRNYKTIIMNLLLGKIPNTIILKNGFQLQTCNETTIFSMLNDIFIKNNYTPQNLPISENDIVMDIGANIGIFTLFAAGRTRNTIYAFEPFPENVELLTRNIQLNNLTKVILKNMAVTDKVGKTKLFYSKNIGGHTTIPFTNLEKLKDFILVPSVNLKKIFDDNNLNKIDFLKLDCEGSEGLIFKSTPYNYLKKIKKIALEFHDNASQLKHDEIQEILQDIGFTTELKWDGKSFFGYLYARQI